MSMKSAALPVRPLSQLFKALSDENRLRIVALLTHGELCVCHIESALELTQPTVSRHLSTLRSAGVVEGRRQGTWMHYRLADQPDLWRDSQLKALMRAFEKQDLLRRDIEKLVKVKGPASCP
jgi:ArsR family transcriptional regulator